MKKTKLVAALAALLCMGGICSNAGAVEATSANNALRIGSGPQGKVYELLVRDMQTVCGSEVPIANVSSIGGIPNLMMLSASQADLGIVQLDTLREMGRDGDENIQTLQAVMPLHINLLHVLALREGSKVGEARVGETKVPFSGDLRVIKKFSELKGVKVAVVGSTMLLGQKLNANFRLDMDLRVAESDDDALRMLKDNKVQAIFTDGGWPLPSIAKHNKDSGLMLVEYDEPVQPPFSIVKRNYQNLSAFNLPFLGSPNVLVTRPFKPSGDMGKRVAALQSCLLRHLEELQEGRFHAAWKEIKNPNDTLGVPKFSSADSPKKIAKAK
jgi:TRAP-type uncharacterized transport system substrate-binding protein